MEYDAIAVGPLDIAAGLEFLQHPDSLKLPLISANIYNQDGTRIFPPYLSIEKAGLKIALVGLTDSVPKEVPGIIINSWEKELTEILPSISSSHDMVALLSTLPLNDLTKIADQYPDIRIIIGADKKKGNINGLLHNKTILAQTASQGKYLGLLSVRWRSGPWAEDQTKKLITLKKQQLSIKRQLKQLKNSGSTENSEYQRKMEFLEGKKIEVSNQLSRLEESSEAVSKTDQLSYFTSILIPLKPSTPEDPEIRDIINLAKKTIRQKSRQ